jgi:hypothetical protein
LWASSNLDEWPVFETAAFARAVAAEAARRLEARQ